MNFNSWRREERVKNTMAKIRSDSGISSTLDEASKGASSSPNGTYTETENLIAGNCKVDIGETECG